MKAACYRMGCESSDESPIELVYMTRGTSRRGVADLYRKDLESGGINKGNHAFSFEVNTYYGAGRAIVINANKLKRS